jgi:hypothetical protein
MLRQLPPCMTYANVMSTIAVFAAVGGGAYAATALPRNSVGAKQIKRNAVVSSKVKNRSLKAADFARNQLPAGSRGATGPGGAQGPPGQDGATGPGGAQGAPGQDGVSGPPTGAASGDLTGSYPGPLIGPDAVGTNEVDGTLTGADVANNQLAGADIDESTLGTVPSATSAASATNADTVDNKNASDFLGTTASAGGDLSGPFSNLALGPDTVDAQNVADDSLSDSNMLDYERAAGAIDDTTSNASPVSFVLDVASGVTIAGVCNKSASNITGSITIGSDAANWAMTSDAPNGQVGQVDLGVGAVRTLIQVGPTPADTFGAGSFYMTTGPPINLAGFVSVRINRSTDQCDFSLTRFGI